MNIFILRRVGSILFITLGVSLLAFILMQLAPGDFLTPLRAQRDVSEEMINKIATELGLDKPMPVQYWNWLLNLAQGDLGYSWTYKMPVSELLWQRVPSTLALSLGSLILAWIIALPLGILAALYKDSWIDKLSAFLAYAALSLPEFFLALLAVFFAANTGWFPIGGKTSIDFDFLSPTAQLIDYLHHLVLPVVVLGIGGVAGMMRLLRANILETLRADFITTAKAKGLSPSRQMFRHVLPNAISPFLSTLGGTLSGLLGGSLLVENIMNYPGLGQLLYQSILREDQFVVMASVVIGCIVLMLGNLISDLLLAWVDPRIRY